MPELSIVIPTYNEEKYLPKLLKCLKEQTFKDFEVIVADKKGKDKTREIAKKFGCIIVDGGLPSKARNNGAKIAKGKYILFLDSDVVFKKDFIEKLIKRFKKKKLVCATVWANNYDKNYPFKSILPYVILQLGNLGILLTQSFMPQSNGFCILVKKEFHNKFKFDESMDFGEDSQYVYNAKKIGKFKILFIIINPSIRRFINKGILKMCFEYIKLNKRRIFNKTKKTGYFDDVLR